MKKETRNNKLNLKINTFFDEKGQDIKDVLEADFKEFLNNYVKILK